MEWKIQIEAAESKRSKSDKDDNYTEDNYVGESSAQINEELGEETSSDINTRDEMADLDSCPDEISKSASKSAGEDILAKADLIADELLAIILDEYKED